LGSDREAIVMARPTVAFATANCKHCGAKTVTTNPYQPAACSACRTVKLREAAAIRKVVTWEANFA
jgi:endogenous inhibitor of DNA gyrase (YacG/DUF329 family)